MYQIGVAFNVLDLSVVDIYWCVVSSPLTSTYSSSDPDFHFHQLIHVALVLGHMVY